MKTLFTKKSLGLAVVIFAVCLLLVSVLKKDNESIRPPLPAAAPSPSPTMIPATMQFQPAQIDTKPNIQFTITVEVDAKNTVVNGIDSLVQFDPEYVKPIKITPPDNPGEFYLLRKQIEQNQVIITSAKTTFTDSRTGLQPIAVITFKPLKVGTTELTFQHLRGTTKGSTIIHADNSSNILDTVQKAIVTIK